MRDSHQWTSGIAFNPTSGSIVMLYKKDKEPTHHVGYVNGTALTLRSSSFTTSGDNNCYTMDTMNVPGHDRVFSIWYNPNAGRGVESLQDLADSIELNKIH